MLDVTHDETLWKEKIESTWWYAIFDASPTGNENFCDEISRERGKTKVEEVAYGR